LDGQRILIDVRGVEFVERKGNLSIILRTSKWWLWPEIALAKAGHPILAKATLI
jgi:hypothetical protein